MNHEDHNRQGVEYSPDWVSEDLELKRIDVAATNLGDGCVVCPEQVQLENAPEIDHVCWRADVVVTKLRRVAEAELEEVDSHESHEHEAGDCQVQHSHSGALHQFKFHVPCALQSHTGVQQDGQNEVLFHNVGGQTEASPVQAYVEVAVTIEVIRPFENVKVAHRMDDDENQEEYCAPRQAAAVVGKLDVGHGENSRTGLIEDRQEEKPTCKDVGLDIDQENTWIFSFALEAPVLSAFKVPPKLVVCHCKPFVLLCWWSPFCAGSCFLLLSCNCAYDGLRSHLLDSARWVDQLPLGGGILAGKVHDCLHATWVTVDEACDVQDTALQHDPAISLLFMLGNLGT
mmetsp:Transcript_150851/g.366388  ORF Transcript_150851/g.366388 Transcript_150851/m.366388 type:complete len:343 (-) Transcript_150851:1566-2594(-)